MNKTEKNLTRGITLLLEFDTEQHQRNFMWRLDTGRLNADLELSVMQYLGANTIGDAIRIIYSAFEFTRYPIKPTRCDLRAAKRIAAEYKTRVTYL